MPTSFQGQQESQGTRRSSAFWFTIVAQCMAFCAFALADDPMVQTGAIITVGVVAGLYAFAQTR